MVWDCHGDNYTWCRWSSEKLHPAPSCATGAKSVSFHEIVDVTLVDGNDSVVFDIQQEVVHDVLRQLWHIDGQLLAPAIMGQMLSRLHMEGRLDISSSTGRFEAGGHHDEASERPGATDDIQANSMALWWPDVVSSSASVTSKKPAFISTWYLAAGRVHLCLRPRRVKVSENQQFHEFQAACAEAWKEYYNDEPCHFYLVDGKPPSLPSTVAHVLIVQGRHSRATGLDG